MKKAKYPIPCYPEYPYLDFRRIADCKGYNYIRGCNLSNGRYLSMMVSPNSFGIDYFVIADQTSRGEARCSYYGESLLSIAHRAKKALNENRAFRAELKGWDILISDLEFDDCEE